MFLRFCYIFPFFNQVFTFLIYTITVFCWNKTNLSNQLTLGMRTFFSFTQHFSFLTLSPIRKHAPKLESPSAAIILIQYDLKRALVVQQNQTCLNCGSSFTNIYFLQHLIRGMGFYLHLLGLIGRYFSSKQVPPFLKKKTNHRIVFYNLPCTL